MPLFFPARLDHLANTIASATFKVINDNEVRTADMGGTYPFLLHFILR